KEKAAREKLEKVNSDLEERNMDLKILLDASDKVGRELDSRKISQDIVDSIPDSLNPLGYKIGVIALYNPDKDCVYVYAVTNSAITKRAEDDLGISVKKFREHLSANDDLTIKTIKNKKIYISSKLEDFFQGFIPHKENGKLQKLIGAKSFVSVPLFANGQVVGAIVFAGDRRADSITKRNKDILKAFSSHIGSAIENAMLYEKTDFQMKELSKLNRSLKKANIKLKELLEVKNEFLHITSHQLRTPLTAIRGMISMWIDGDFDKFSKTRRAEMLQRIYNSTERLNNLTNDMLDALELEGGVLQFEFKKVSVVDIIKDTVVTLDQEYKEKKLYLKFEEPASKIPDIEAEPNYMAQVFMNLIDNACKYTKKGGTKIKIVQTEGYVNVYIEDTGMGIEDKDKEKVFEKFTRGDNAFTENASGSGLGLFIVKKIVMEHNGNIKLAKGAGGKGTLFKVSLPLKQE
ncbi:MAG: GAF domain-containing sensor histidine kinase, partial [Candidatus Pacebacteria bacterium]|nr:GAF domain-containing sensor histidine kinase [Candidatus Paceibacterota bacterium]